MQVIQALLQPNITFRLHLDQNQRMNLLKLREIGSRNNVFVTQSKELRSCWRNMNVSCSRSFCNQISTLSLLVYLLVIFLTQRIFSILVIDVHYSHVCLSKVSACNIDALLNLQRCIAFNDHYLPVSSRISLYLGFYTTSKQ